MNYSQPANGGGAGSNVAPMPTASSALPPLPQGKDLPAGMTCTDAISRTLNTLPPAQLLDILQQMKTLATTDPARATELLSQAPQLSYAIFQALLIMGLVSPDAINSVLDGGSVLPLAHPAPIPAPTASPMGYGYPGATGTPPVAVGGYAPPAAVPTAPAPAPAAPPAQDPEALMQAVMELSQDMIDQLPDAERQQIMALRASYAHQRRL
jgi:cleavage stimulation factor subunit 2